MTGGGLCRGCAYHDASQNAVHHMVSVKMLCMTGGFCPEAVHDRRGLSRGCA